MALVIKVIPIKAEAFDSAKVMKNIGESLERSGKRMQKKFAETIKNFTEETVENPTMDYEVEVGDKDASVWAGPRGSERAVEKWSRLDNGSMYPHVILPRRATYLKFPFQGVGDSYIPSTTPRQFSSTRRQKLGPYVYRRSVWHPGFEARMWSDQMAIEELPELAKDVQEAIDKGLA